MPEYPFAVESFACIRQVIFIDIAFAEAFDDAAAAFPDKSDDFIPFIGGGKFLFQEFQGLAGIYSLIVNDPVDIEDMIDLIDGETSAFKSDRIHAAIAQGQSACLDIGRNILSYQRTAL